MIDSPKPAREPTFFTCGECGKRRLTYNKKKQFCNDICRAAHHNRERMELARRVIALEARVAKLEGKNDSETASASL